jgi:hypothetical protein
MMFDPSFDPPDNVFYLKNISEGDILSTPSRLAAVQAASLGVGLV